MASQAGAAPSLPVAQVPHDTLRQGLPMLKGDLLSVHPVEEIQSRARFWIFFMSIFQKHFCSFSRCYND